MNEKILISEQEWVRIFEEIWNKCRALEKASSFNRGMGAWDYVVLNGHKYYFPETFTDCITDNVIEEVNDLSEELDQEELDDDYTPDYLCRTDLVREDSTVWKFYILTCHDNYSEDYLCGKEYIELTDEYDEDLIVYLKQFLGEQN